MRRPAALVVVILLSRALASAQAEVPAEPLAPPPTPPQDAAPLTAPAPADEPAPPPPDEPPPTRPVEPAPPPPEMRVFAPEHGAGWIKGDLVHVGTRRLLSRFDHVGVALGGTVLDNDVFLTVTPGTAFYLGKFAFSLGVPLNLQAFDGGSLAVGSFRVRRQDWDEISDFARVLRFVTYGRKEDPLYLTINSLRPATLGHGELVNNYNANIDIDRSLTGLMFDAYNDYAGFQLQANDVTFQNRVVGALAFVKPLAFFAENGVARSVSLGVEYAGDLAAPVCLRQSAAADAPCVQGSGNSAGFDPFTGASRDGTFVRTDRQTGRPFVTAGLAHAAGASAEVKVLKVTDAVDVKLYGTWHRFMNEGGGDGAAAGVLGRFNAGAGLWRNAFRLRAEFRNFGDGYLPGYFDSLYEIQKYAFPQTSGLAQVTPTKYQAVFGDPANGFAPTSFGRVNGYSVDLQWGVYLGGAQGKLLSLGVGLQDSQRADDTRFHAHLEFPLLGFVQLFGSYMRVNAPGPAELFGPDMFTAPNSVVLTGVRLQLLPILFVNAHYSRSFRVTRSPGSEYHLGNERVVDDAGRPSQLFATDQLFENVQTLWVELELGWELNGDKDRADKASRLGEPSDQEGR